MVDTGQELGRPIDAAEGDTREQSSARQRFFVRPQGPAPVKARKARTTGLLASAAHALEQRQLFVVLPYAIIVGLVASLLTDEAPAPWALAAVGIALAMALWLARRTVATLRLLAIAAAFWTGFSLLAIHGALFGTPMLWGSMYGTYQARVDGVIAVTPGGRRLLISDIEPVAPAKPVPFRRARILVKAGPTLAPGDILEGPIRFYSVPGPPVPGAYDAEFHSYFDGIGAYGDATKPVTLVSTGQPLALDRGIDTIRQTIGARIKLVLDDPAQGIARALITGDQTAVTDASRKIMATAGLAHVLAISGFHLALVAGTVFAALRLLLALIGPVARRFSPKRLAAVGGIIAAIGYFMISGFDVAALRSTVMIVLVFGAVLVGRRALTMRNIAIAALVTVLSDPANVFRPSFQLSFTAVIALVGMYEILPRRIDHRRGPVAHATGHLLGIATTSLIAGTATTLFAIYHFQQTSPLGIIGNLLTLPLVTFIMMPAAMLSVIAMPFGAEWPFLWVMGWAIDRMLDLAGLVAQWSEGINASPLLTPLALFIGLLALGWFSFFTNRYRLIGPALAVPAVLLLALDHPPDVLISDTTQALAVRDSGGLQLVGGRPEGFVVTIWRQTYHDAIEPAPRSETNCDAVGCVSASPLGFTVAVSKDEAALDDDCANADLVVTRLRAPANCRAETTVIDGDDLAKGGVQWLRWDAGDKRFEVRPSVTGLNRPWRSGR